MKLESELNEKNKNIDMLKNNIKDLENEKREIINKSDKTYNRKIERLEKELKK